MKNDFTLTALGIRTVEMRVFSKLKTTYPYTLKDDEQVVIERKGDELILTIRGKEKP